MIQHCRQANPLPNKQFVIFCFKVRSWPAAHRPTKSSQQIYSFWIEDNISTRIQRKFTKKVARQHQGAPIISSWNTNVKLSSSKYMQNTRRYRKRNKKTQKVHIIVLFRQRITSNLIANWTVVDVNTRIQMTSADSHLQRQWYPAGIFYWTSRW